MPRSGSARAWTLLRAVAVLGAVASAGAAVEYVLAPGSLCSQGSGCARVREATGALGAALPAVGLAGFTVVFVGSLIEGALARRATRVASYVAAAVGVALLLAQLLWVKALCTVCVGADAAGLALGACAAFAPEHAPVRRRLPIALHLAWYLPLSCAPLAWALARPLAVPVEVSSLWKAGKINVVEFSDFECPYCRGLHPHLATELERLGARVHFVRKSYPLPGHVHARVAAAAYRCASLQGKGEAMADALFASESLALDVYPKLARRLGLDADALDACMRSPATATAIAADMALVRASGFRGLPTVWIQDQRIEGFDRARGGEPYRRALDDASRGATSGHRATPWLALVAVAGALLALGLRQRRSAGRA